jgi:hypothetical protein
MRKHTVMDGIATYSDMDTYRVIRKFSPKSNLCSRYFDERKKFCGNYCSRKKSPHHTRCWRHTRIYSKLLPPVIIVMITANGKIYNKSKWLKFLTQCENNGVPLHLVVYACDMFNTTVRHPWNFISRFRPFPNVYHGRGDISLVDAHGKMQYTSVVMNMLEYGSIFEHARCCILITEKTIPIRSAKSIYKSALSYGDKCVLDPGYNIRFSEDLLPVPHRRGNIEFGLVNCRGQGLLSNVFLKEAIPTLPTYCSRFGLVYKNGVYEVEDMALFNRWREHVSANPDEFWLLNSYLFHLFEQDGHKYPIRVLRNFMHKLPANDNTIIAEIAEYRNDTKRSAIFDTEDGIVHVDVADTAVKEYYKRMQGSKGMTVETNLRNVIRFLHRYKKRVLFFRSVAC